MSAHATHLVFARGTTLEAALDDIQIMPPGVHEIEPLSAADGKPVKLTVTVDASTAERLEAARAAYQAAADAGTGDAPYFDFNHQDGPAAAWVKAIYWGGDDAVTGGVRAKVEWSAAGREAVEGKAFRRFSPSFSVEAASGTIIGAPVNMGGLVNRAAFRTINAFFAADQTDPAQPEDQPTTTTMTEEQIAALRAENEALREQVARLTASVEAAARSQAEAEVEAAAREGRIPAATEVKAKWVRSILGNPEARELLASLPANEALKPVIEVKTAPVEATDVLARYEAMADGPEKDKFRRENASALLVAARAASTK